MMRSLWTAASGMKAQQLSVDTISNNLANVDTTAYKKERVEFKSLLYQTLSRSSADEAGSAKPTNLQVGLGVRSISTTRDFTMGNVDNTGNALDLAFDGEGFLTIQRGEEIVYTKDANLKLGLYEGEYILTTSEGYPVLDTESEYIYIPEEVTVDNLVITEEGDFQYMNADNEAEDLGQRLGVVQFQNKQGLEAIGGNFYKETVASGPALFEADGDLATTTRVMQGYREASNVQVAEEMVKLIVAQRAYELNSKAIQTSDSMLEQANNLKR